MNKTYIDYLFEDEDTGEMFFVEVVKDGGKSWTDCYNEAWDVALENFENPAFVKKVAPEIAETYGYDIY